MPSTKQKMELLDSGHYHTNYRDTKNATGYTNAVENDDVTRICSVRKLIYFSHIHNPLGRCFA